MGALNQLVPSYVCLLYHEARNGPRLSKPSSQCSLLVAAPGSRARRLGVTRQSDPSVRSKTTSATTMRYPVVQSIAESTGGGGHQVLATTAMANFIILAMVQPRWIDLREQRAALTAVSRAPPAVAAKQTDPTIGVGSRSPNVRECAPHFALRTA